MHYSCITSEKCCNDSGCIEDTLSAWYWQLFSHLRHRHYRILLILQGRAITTIMADDSRTRYISRSSKSCNFQTISKLLRALLRFFGSWNAEGATKFVMQSKEDYSRIQNWSILYEGREISSYRSSTRDATCDAFQNDFNIATDTIDQSHFKLFHSRVTSSKQRWRTFLFALRYLCKFQSFWKYM